MPPISHAPVHVKWLGESRFEAGRTGEPQLQIDGDGRVAPSPFDALLAAIATCASVDIVSILAKQRTPAQALTVRVDATRAAGTPRRLVGAVLHFTIEARGAARAAAGRAVELAVTKYCSVRSSLAGDVPVTWTIELRDGQGDARERTGSRGARL